METFFFLFFGAFSVVVSPLPPLVHTIQARTPVLDLIRSRTAGQRFFSARSFFRAFLWGQAMFPLCRTPNFVNLHLFQPATRFYELVGFVISAQGLTAPPKSIFLSIKPFFYFKLRRLGLRSPYIFSLPLPLNSTLL